MKDAPLKEALLLAGVLAAFIWPLVIVSGKNRTVKSTSSPEATVEGLPATVLVKAAHEFLWFELRRGEELLGRIEGPEFEGEFECALALHGEVLLVEAEFPEGAPETALRTSIWGEGMPEEVLTFWTEDRLFEEVEIQFHE